MLVMGCELILFRVKKMEVYFLRKATQSRRVVNTQIRRRIEWCHWNRNLNIMTGNQSGRLHDAKTPAEDADGTQNQPCTHTHTHMYQIYTTVYRPHTSTIMDGTNAWGLFDP